MFEWSEEQLAIRDAVRRFVEEEIKPNVEELEHASWTARSPAPPARPAKRAAATRH
jgi:alkylation response protein AidB-like acyl-CoA dehydrogenase